MPPQRCLLENDLLRAEIDPAVGACITDLAIRGPRAHGWPILRRSPGIVNRGEDTACYLLSPWSNRIRDAAFRFNGRDIRLRPNWPDGTAIHGDVRDRPWRILDRSPVSARLLFDSRAHDNINWPWSFTTQARFELTEQGLECDLTITNTDESPMPAGGGFHPFFSRTLWDVRDEIQVRAAVTGRYPCERIMPTGPASMDDLCERLNRGTSLDMPLDDVFDCPTGRAELRWTRSGVRASFESSSNFGHLVIFSPIAGNGSPYPFFCVEPVSMVNDGFNLMASGQVRSHGVQVLQPGERLDLSWRMRISID